MIMALVILIMGFLSVIVLVFILAVVKVMIMALVILIMVFLSELILVSVLGLVAHIDYVVSISHITGVVLIIGTGRQVYIFNMCSCLSPCLMTSFFSKGMPRPVTSPRLSGQQTGRKGWRDELKTRWEDNCSSVSLFIHRFKLFPTNRRSVNRIYLKLFDDYFILQPAWIEMRWDIQLLNRQYFTLNAARILHKPAGVC